MSTTSLPSALREPHGLEPLGITRGMVEHG